MLREVKSMQFVVHCDSRFAFDSSRRFADSRQRDCRVEQEPSIEQSAEYCLYHGG